MKRGFRRFFAEALTVLLLCAMLPATALADIDTVAGFECQTDGSILTLTGSGELDLAYRSLPWPKELFNTVIVIGATSIDNRCFMEWPNLQSVTLPDGLTTIGDYAFLGCSALTQARLPGSLTTIGDRAFYRCSSLALTELPAGVTTIGDRAFYSCSSLALTELPAGVTTIGDSAFYRCSSLALTKLPAGVTTIGDSAFDGCNSLALTELPAGVTTIGDRAFYSCHRLALTELPAGVTTIGDHAFYSCESLALTELPAGVTTIGNCAFSYCRRLALTELPEGVTTIGDLAFQSCDGLTHLTLPASLTSMESYVFQESNNLTSLTFLGKTAPTIDSLTFTWARGLQEILIPEGATGYDADHGWPMDKVKVGHTVTVHSASGGSAGAAPTYAGEGDAIVLTATPNEGYHFVRWQTEPELEVTDNSFSMPNADVTVTPVFEAHDFSGDWKTSASRHWHECVCGEKRDEGEHTYKGGVCTTCGYSYDYDIFVKILTGDHITLKIKSSDTVRSVKEKLEASEGIPAAVQQLTFASKLLADDQILLDCGIVKDSTLHLTLRYAPGGTGSEDDPYLIPDAEQLEAFQYYINNMSTDGGAGKYFKLTADIDLENEPWTPIGTDFDTSFKGVFDGGGHTISGLYIFDRSSKNQGLFGAIGAGSVVKNLTVAGSVTGSHSVGGIVGENSGSIENCVNEATVTGEHDVGGVEGLGNMSSTVKNCCNTGAVTGNSGSVGGIAGYAYAAAVENCYNYGQISGQYGAGGIAGDDGFTAVTNCYYLDACGAGGKGTAKTADEFASGEVAYLLQAGQSAQEPLTWGQGVTNGGADPLPILTDEAADRVYQVTFRADLTPEYEKKLYANPGGTLPEAETLKPEKEGYTFVKWALTDSPEGEAFTASTLVKGDLTLYAIFEKAAEPTPTESKDPAPSETEASRDPTIKPSGEGSGDHPSGTPDDVPKTGDEGQLFLWLALTLLSLAGAVATAPIMGRKRPTGPRKGNDRK